MQSEYLTLQDWKVTVEEIRVSCMRKFRDNVGDNIKRNFCL